MRVAVVQTKPVFGEVQTNIAEALGLMDSIQADLFVLPELFNTGYNFTSTVEAGNLAETADGQTYRAVQSYAAKRKCHVVYGFAEQGDRLYNSAALVGPKGLVGVYRKVHLFFREKLIFAPGNLGFPVFDLPFGKVGIMICFDWIYPEAARTLALRGAQLIVHPSNLVTPYCPDAMVTRALENRIFIATTDRVGRENRNGLNLTFIGTSEIVSPKGEILTRLDNTNPGVGVAEIDLDSACSKKFNEYNDLFVDRRTDQYT